MSTMTTNTYTSLPDPPSLLPDNIVMSSKPEMGMNRQEWILLGLESMQIVLASIGSGLMVWSFMEQKIHETKISTLINTFRTGALVAWPAVWFNIVPLEVVKESPTALIGLITPYLLNSMISHKMYMWNNKSDDKVSIDGFNAFTTIVLGIVLSTTGKSLSDKSRKSARYLVILSLLLTGVYILPSMRNNFDQRHANFHKGIREVVLSISIGILVTGLCIMW